MSEEICDGVKMLIERMQTNPDDFDFGGKLQGYRNTMEEVLQNPPAHQPLWFLNETEKKALITAYTNMHKQMFTTGVVQNIFNDRPEWDANMDAPLYKGPSKIITPQYMVKEVEQLLDEKFEKEYAKNSNP